MNGLLYGWEYCEATSKHVCDGAHRSETLVCGSGNILDLDF